MKIATILTAAAVAVPQAAAQLQLRDMNDGPAALKGAESRGLFSQQTVNGANTVVFEECLGRPAPACRGMIAKAVQGNPHLFGGRTSLNFLTVPVRTASDSEYHKVFLRMDQTETVVEGVLGDSMVFYPHPWCPPEGECYPIGPWDCALGDPLSFNDCCAIVTQGVPTDVNGHDLTCEASAPVGSASNPRDEGRVVIHVDEDNNVAHPPVNQ